jgi:hypothetical protein
MIKMPALVASIALVLGTYSIALCQGANHDTADKSMSPISHPTADKSMVSVSDATVPITDEGLQRLGVKNLKGNDVAKMATIVNLLSVGRRGGGAGGGRLNYTCESTSNACSCTGWLDCVLVMDECRTPPVNSDGTICSGAAPCTCTWH